MTKNTSGLSTHAKTLPQEAKLLLRGADALRKKPWRFDGAPAMLPRLLGAVPLASAAPHPHARAKPTIALLIQVEGKVLSRSVRGRESISTVDDEIAEHSVPTGGSSTSVASSPIPLYRDWRSCAFPPTATANESSSRFCRSPGSIWITARLESRRPAASLASSRPLPDGTPATSVSGRSRALRRAGGERNPLLRRQRPESFWNGDASMIRDGTLYFTRTAAAEVPCTSNRSPLCGRKYAEPEKLGPEINSGLYDFQPSYRRTERSDIRLHRGGQPALPPRPER